MKSFADNFNFSTCEFGTRSAGEMLCNKVRELERALQSARSETVEECARVCEARIQPGTTGDIDEERDDEARACAQDIRALAGQKAVENVR